MPAAAISTVTTMRAALSSSHRARYGHRGIRHLVCRRHAQRSGGQRSVPRPHDDPRAQDGRLARAFMLYDDADPEDHAHTLFKPAGPVRAQSFNPLLLRTFHEN